MAMLLAQGLRHFKKQSFVRMMELLATSPEFHDAHPDIVEQRVQAKCASRVSRGAIGTQLRCLARSEVKPEDYHITAPTLVLAGEYDPIIPGCYAQRMADMIPGAEFRLFEGAGHNPIVDEPEMIVPLIEQFVYGDREQSQKGNEDQIASHALAAWGGEQR
jgi:pimeloyl-ACP methyl ester carboxylesterase